MTLSLPSLDEIYHALLAEDFGSFVQFCFSVIRPGVDLQLNWHHRAMAYKLAQIASGEIKRLIITLPPRSLKSLCASVALPAFFLGHNPSERVIVATYSDQLSRVHAQDFRAVVQDATYQQVFPHMRVMRDNEREIVTTKRGKRTATSIEGTLTGLGGNLLIVDDPIKAGDVFSESARNRVLEWYRSTLLSRADDKSKARIVVVMQRVHQDDLVGYLQEQGGFEVLNLPAIAQREERYELGNGGIYTRQKGELLHPAHESAQVLLELKRAMGPIAFASQYQQNPTPPGGNLILLKWLSNRYSDLQIQLNDRIIMSWDIALGETDSTDYSACVVLLARGETIYVLEVIRERLPFDALKRKIIEIKRRYGTGILLIEQSPISLGLIQSLREQAINVTPYKPTTDKRARVIEQTDLFAGGSIRLPTKAPWLETFVQELLAFPGRHDDQVDALVQGIAWARKAWYQRAFVGRITGLI